MKTITKLLMKYQLNKAKIDWSKVTTDKKVRKLLEDRIKLENEIREIDNMALIRLELELLQD